ncbi:hypothetical protein D9M69_510080 [compost metagenome]
MGGITTPAEPAKGSTITAAMVEASCSAIRSSRRSASSAPFSGMPRVKALAASCVCGRWSASMPWPNSLRLAAMPPTEMPP